MPEETARDSGVRTRESEAYPSALRDAEAKAIEIRRSRLSHEERPLPNDLLGFGLSGGGIRSATFCLGIFQALAKNRLVRRIDFLSTVSGGGYFGAFLGRLFTRDWIRGVDDVEQVLQGIDLAEATRDRTEQDRTRWGSAVFRWLRENGRYLAPRGSGDLLLLVSTVLRNLVAVQIVMITTVLTLFLFLQLVRERLEVLFPRIFSNPPLLVCDFPGSSWLWWSPWVLVAIVPFLLIATPAGWAYWLVVRVRGGLRGRLEAVPPFIGFFIAVASGVFLTMRYGQKPGHPGLLFVATAVVVAALLALAFWAIGELTVSGPTPADFGNKLRSRLTRAMNAGLILTAVALGWALIDTLGGTLYALLRSHGALARWTVGFVSGFTVVGTFGRQIASMFLPKKRGARPGLPTSVLTWIAAVVVAASWLIAIDIGSHAIVWEFGAPASRPAWMTSPPASPTILGADHVEATQVAAGRVEYRAVAAKAAGCEAASGQLPPLRFPLAAFACLALLTLAFGWTRTFANMSSIHTLYAARLMRTYLGASNPPRLAPDARPATEAIVGDDYSSERYWRWPGEPGAPDGRPLQKGGPLHIVNTTVNETFDGRTKVQNQDRKGTILAIGPCGLSVGIRHHLISADGDPIALPADAEPPWRVFYRRGAWKQPPDPLTLGKWMSISGAAFSAASGVNTTVPRAILAGLFNVRLGFWWDSGTPTHGWWLESALPVQAALLAESLAKTRGTAGRFWNLSDGGHFENMGGYELIRRRVPVIVVVDAEADPEYAFGGLSDLVRKARLDFEAEIVFLSEDQLSTLLSGEDGAEPRPFAERAYMGSLDALRRGRWTKESLPFARVADKGYDLAVDESSVSRAHAALARVEYPDGGCSWLLYVKATLMGAEPADVCEYHRAHPAFPQETTLDQFFDEPQWESYRRLGLHIGHRVLTPTLLDYLRDHPAREFDDRW